MAVESQGKSESPRRTSLGNERRRESTSSNHRAPHNPSQQQATERRDIPHIKRVSISATHL
ncbi:hypothetical protein ANCCAN_23498 [Ancylostoma caninum]|uniref:Uncharacterized protein n=1 Tax=Ancylostoma caninum TaxID=29170 RepID=A0A368FIT8_ANCCA|nr:hypothetical protein ANCCAN_23498 [Ancylostoma caninum]